MAGDTDQNTEPEWLKDLPIQSERIGFAPGELVTCANCGKPNAPNRASCIYCGTVGDGAAADKFQIGALEDWENGFNIVLIDTSNGDLDGAAGVLAETTSGVREFINATLEGGKQIPIVRIASTKHAESIRDVLSGFGIETMIVADEALRATSPPVRLRSIAFEPDRLDLRLFNTNEIISIACDELVLIVHGTIIEGRTESRERKKLRGSKMLDESSTSSDEPVIDLYSINDPIGWRIPARGFDFTCLGDAKSLIVGDNMKSLIAKLIEFAPHANVVDDYRSVHSLVESVWPSEVRREGRVIDRKNVSTILKTNNAAQFTKYSRLQWRLRYEEKV